VGKAARGDKVDVIDAGEPMAGLDRLGMEYIESGAADASLTPAPR
jgi:hypothetical protein